MRGCVWNEEKYEKMLHLNLDAISSVLEDLDPETILLYFEDFACKMKLLDCLTQRQLFVITHRFGLFGESDKALAEVAKLLRVSSIEVPRQIEAKAFRRMHYFACKWKINA
jgi:DNA-directed RNA polymerase sigma subunit (sigma70/sigma32)